MEMEGEYVQIQESDVPEGVRFDLPKRNEGQMIERAYGGFGRSEHDHGDPYMRKRDRGIGGGTTYYKWVTR